MGVLNDEADLEHLLHNIDPYNNQKITYSEIVALLSSQMVPRDSENTQMIPMLEKYVNLDAVETENYQYSSGAQLEEVEH